MIEGTRQRHRRPRHDCSVDDDRPRLQGPHTEDRRFGIVDDGHSLVQPECAEIRHGERGPLQLSRFDRARPRLVDEPSHRRRQLACRFVLRVLDHRHQQPARRRHPDAEMHCRMDVDVRSARGVHPRRVEHRMMGQGDRQQPKRQDERRDRRPVIADLFAQPVTHLQQRRAVDLHAGVRIGDLAPRQRHPLCHRRLHTVNADVVGDLVRLARNGEHIVAGDDPVRAGARRQ